MICMATQTARALLSDGQQLMEVGVLAAALKAGLDAAVAQRLFSSCKWVNQRRCGHGPA